MKKFLSVFMAFSLACALFFSSCSGEDGSVSDGEWTVAEHNVTLVIDGETEKEYSGKEISFARYAQTYGKTGYKIAWTDAAGNAITEEKMAANEKTKYTFYGTSSPISYTVHFDSTDCKGTAPADISCTYDVEFDMPENEFSAAGKFSVGWCTKKDYTLADYGKFYKGKTKAKNLSTTDGDIVTLYPYLVSEDALCVVTIVSDYGGLSEAEKTIRMPSGWTVGYGDADCDYTLPELDDDDYGFEKWTYGTENKELSRYAKTVTITQSTTFTAHWLKKCTITFESKYGTVPEAVKVKSGVYVVKKGYSFTLSGEEYYYLPDNISVSGKGYTSALNSSGWKYETESGSKTVDSYTSVKVTKDMTFTAVWYDTLCKVKIESAHGTVEEPDFYVPYLSGYSSLNAKFYSPEYTGYMSSYDYKLPAIPATDGYVLTGWTYKKAGDSSSTSLSSTSPVTITSDITFTAVWTVAASAKISITLPAASSDDIALTNSDGTLTASLSGASTFKWYINGTEKTTGASFNIYDNYGSLSGGVNSIMAVATISGKTYSATAMVKKAN